MNYALLRSLPDLQLVSESSLMSILRWNFKAKIEATMSSDGEHISMVLIQFLTFVL